VSMSFSEIIVVFVVALLLFGPDQLPQIARGFGKLAAELRKASDAVRREWYNAVYPPAEEIRRDLAAHSKDLRTLRAEVLSPPEGAVGSPSKKHKFEQPVTTEHTEAVPAKDGPPNTTNLP